MEKANYTQADHLWISSSQSQEKIHDESDKQCKSVP